MPNRSPEAGPAVLTVSQLTAQIKMVLESEFPQVTVLGEISNLRPAASGHVYLTLKDDAAQIPAVLWRSRASRVRFDLQNGLEVVAGGTVEVYPPHGKYQLIIDRIVPQGIGSLELAFRQLKEKLQAEGLFAEDRKRPLPRFPRRIAIISSPTGAAIRDLLQVITRRWTGADIVLLPVAVQGDNAASQIAAALQTAPDIPDVDVVITGRGGGSLEDLWAFNEEIVARAIFQSPVPVVSAVGHEIDVSIADLVADRRALTPSEAGELVVPDRIEVRASLDRFRDRMIASLRQQAQQARSRLETISTRRVFARPLQALHDRTARVDDLAERLHRAAAVLQERRRQRLANLGGALDALSPFKVLQRGYSVTLDDGGVPIRSIEQVDTGEEIHTLLQDGTVVSRVESVDGGRRPPQPRLDSATSHPQSNNPPQSSARDANR